MKYQVEITPVKDSGIPGWAVGLAFVFVALMVLAGAFGPLDLQLDAAAAAAAVASAPAQTGLTVQTDASTSPVESATATAANTAEPATTPDTTTPAATSDVAQTASITAEEAAASEASPAPAGRACRTMGDGRLVCRGADGEWRAYAQTASAPADASANADESGAPPAQRCEASTAAYRRAKGDSLTAADYHAFYERCLVSDRSQATAGLY